MQAQEATFSSRTGEGIFFGIGSFGSDDPQKGLGTCVRFVVEGVTNDIIAQSIAISLTCKLVMEALASSTLVSEVRSREPTACSPVPKMSGATSMEEWTIARTAQTCRNSLPKMIRCDPQAMIW